MGQQRSLLNEPADFSLVLGGPLYQLYLRTRLATPTLDLLRRRIIGISLIAWLPLLLLTAFAGQVVGGVAVPFLFDLDAHARFLGSLPLMIAAEMIVHQRIRLIVKQFLDRDIIGPEDRLRFEGIIASAMRLRNSVLVEVLLAVFVFTVVHWVWRGYITLAVATWYAAAIDGQTHLTPAGYWYALVSLPIYRFILLRWYFRLFIWYRFLWQVSRLPLRVNALHSDRAGGLGFLAGSVPAFAPVLVAHTMFLAGWIANQIWHQGATLPDFKLEIAAVMALLMLLVLAPLTFFVGHLARAKRSTTREYGIVASCYVEDFRRKWIEGTPGAETLVGSADIQSLADLSNSFDVVRETRLLPFGRETVVQLAIMIALPLLPLALTMISVEEIIDRLVKMAL